MFSNIRLLSSSVVLTLCLAVSFTLLSPSGAWAADAEIKQLLDQIKKGRSSDKQIDQKRLRDFQKRKKDQKALLRREQEINAQLEAKAARLDREYNDNEKELGLVRSQFQERLGSLKELFGVLQAVSGDLRANVAGSVTQVENLSANPENGRLDFLADFAKKMDGKNLPAIEDMERLWLEFSTEIFASGEVKRFNARVELPNGQNIDQDVVRAGLFNVVSENGFLNYKSGQKQFNTLLRQPPGRFQNSATDLAEVATTEEVVPLYIDPTRGQLLGLIVDLPTLTERIDQGGAVGYLIICLGLIALVMSAYRFWRLRRFHSAIEKQRKDLENPNEKNPLGFVLSIYQRNKHQELETLELMLEEAIMVQTPKFTRNLPMIKIISVVAPLMGLLGTVTGMIITFQSITQFGAGDPKLMASGISQALMTTVLGLVVAIPTVFLHSILSSQARKLTQFLEERVTGLLAGYSVTTSKPTSNS